MEPRELPMVRLSLSANDKWTSLDFTLGKFYDNEQGCNMHLVGLRVFSRGESIDLSSLLRRLASGAFGRLCAVSLEFNSYEELQRATMPFRSEPLPEINGWPCSLGCGRLASEEKFGKIKVLERNERIDIDPITMSPTGTLVGPSSVWTAVDSTMHM